MTLASIIAAALRDPELRAAVVEIIADGVAAAHARRPEPVIVEHMTRSQYATRSGVSVATVARWLKEGMPSIGVGVHDRIDPAAADHWRKSRTRKPTTPTKKTNGKNSVDELDVSSSLRAAGLTGSSS